MIGQPQQLSEFAFGTSGIMGAAFTDKGRLRLLETAFDRNVTHFDTAPLYGQGDAEKLLGKFARLRRDQITISTKFGLQARKYPKALRLIKPVARVVNRGVKEFNKKRALRINSSQNSREELSTFQATAISAAVYVEHSKPLSVERLQQQVYASLSALGSDHIDALLLHEVKLGQLNDEFIAALERLCMAGQVRTVGLATSRSETEKILASYPLLGSFVQVAATSFIEDSDPLSSGRINFVTHSAIQNDMLWLSRWLSAQPKLLQEFDFADLPSVCARLALFRSQTKTAGGTVLFSSSHNTNIVSNTAALENERQLLDRILLELNEQGQNN